MKPIMLYAAALFLITAPAPDSSDIAEMTSNFIVPEEIPGLMAAEDFSQADRKNPGDAFEFPRSTVHPPKL